MTNILGIVRTILEKKKKRNKENHIVLLFIIKEGFQYYSRKNNDIHFNSQNLAKSKIRLQKSKKNIQSVK